MLLSAMKKVFKRIYAIYVGIETELAEKLGNLTRRRLEERYPSGIPVKIGKPFMIRLKVQNSGLNYIAWHNDDVPKLWRCKLLQMLAQVRVIRWAEAEDYWQQRQVHGIYERVYECSGGQEGFVLSLTAEQVAELVGREVRITRFGVVVHIGHRFLLGSDVEVYPQEWTLQTQP